MPVLLRAKNLLAVIWSDGWYGKCTLFAVGLALTAAPALVVSSVADGRRLAQFLEEQQCEPVSLVPHQTANGIRTLQVEGFAVISTGYSVSSRNVYRCVDGSVYLM